MDELLPPEPHASFQEPLIAQDPPLIMSGSDGRLGHSMDIGRLRPSMSQTGHKSSMNVLNTRHDTS